MVGVQPESAALTVVRIKHAPDLDPAMAAIVRILRSELKRKATISELVCDFAQDQAARWVFLCCQGLAFQPARQLLAVTIAPQLPINSGFLLYPVAAQTKEVADRLNWNTKLHDIATQQHLSWTGFLRTGKEYSELPQESKREDEPQRKTSPQKSRLVEEVISREVDRMDLLLCRSRASRTQAAERLNFVEKYGGGKSWEPVVYAALLKFYRHDDIEGFVLEGMSPDQMLLVSNSVMRVLRGEYNFYYKEILRKVHQNYTISPHHFQILLQVLAEAVSPICSPEHTEAILQRFKEFKPYICHSS